MQFFAWCRIPTGYDAVKMPRHIRAVVLAIAVKFDDIVDRHQGIGICRILDNGDIEFPITEA